MKQLLKHIAVLLLLCVHSSSAKAANPIAEYRLDERTVYAIPVSRSRVTTISFPGPISAVDAANVTSDPKIPGLVSNRPHERLVLPVREGVGRKGDDQHEHPLEQENLRDRVDREFLAALLRDL